MKFRTLLFTAITLLGMQANAQTWVADSATMSAGYANDVYYSLKNGAVGTPVANNNWHLGFEMIPGGPGFGGVSIIANHVQGGVKVFSLHTTGTAKFASLAAADTAGMTQLYNADSSWDWGAFNTNASTTMFDYGWGKYNATTHYVDGDSLYLVYAAGNVYKMVINHYHSYPATDIYYAFHMAKFDGSDDMKDTVRKNNGYMVKNFAYYDLITHTDFIREPDQTAWDIVFTRYIEYISMGPGPLVPYPVMGVLSNVGVQVADVRGVSADTTHYNGRAFSKNMHEIGSDWKSFNNTTFTYQLDTTATFFVETADSNIYQIKFTGFTSSAGKSVFNKRFIEKVVSVKDVTNNIERHAIVPNPANYNADLVLSARAAADAVIIVTDITGKVLQNAPVKLNTGLNALRINTADYATGTYLVTVTNGSWKVTEKLSVQH